MRHAFDPLVEFTEWIAIGDTTIDGQLCRVIVNPQSLYRDISDTVITYEDSNRIYWHNPLIQEFTLLYDFNKTTGGTWHLQIEDTCGATVEVFDTGTDTINGHVLKTMNMGTQEIDAMGGKAIKYIGNTSHPAPFALDCYGKIKDGAYYNGLRCYEDTIIGFHNFGISPTCTHIANNLESPQADMQFGISPNPASGVLFVQVSVAGAIVVVYDIHGRKLHQQTSTDKQTLSYDTRRYAPGLYVFTLEKDGRVLDKRKVLFVE